MNTTHTVLVIVGDCHIGDEHEVNLITAFDDPVDALMEVARLQRLAREFCQQQINGNHELDRGLRAELEHTTFSVMPITLGRLGPRYTQLDSLDQALLEASIRP